jgi:phospholipase/carboxylesterase
MHGYGSNEEDLFSFSEELPEEYYVISARAPYDLQYGSYGGTLLTLMQNQNKFSDNDQAIKSRDAIVAFIDELIVKYPIDAANVNLLGFSQGSILV